jgi:hypothetical protein
MRKGIIKDDNGESGNSDEKSNEDSRSNHTKLSKWPNRIKILTSVGTLIVTGVLALITYCHLDEVKRQRELTYKRFVMANRPNLNFFRKGPILELKDQTGFIRWRVDNTGGDVEDVKFQSMLFYITLKKNKPDFSIKAFYVRNIRIGNLNKGAGKEIDNRVEDINTLNKIKKIIASDQSKERLGLYLRVEYTIPAELTVGGMPEKDSRFQIMSWNVIHNSFKDIPPKYYDRVTEKIIEKKFDLLKDQG